MYLPLLWRFILRRYSKIFLLCFFGIIATLLVARAQDIARFISIAPNIWVALKFTLFQVPYIIPFALPLSALISTYLLMTALCGSHELTALRASGLSLRKIVYPLIYLALVFSCVNFYVASELVPISRYASKELVKSVAAMNPLVLMQNDELMKMKHRYATLDMVRSPDLAENALFAILNPQTQKIQLVIARELSYAAGELKGAGVSVITGSAAGKPGFDHLVIDNQRKTVVQADVLTDLVYKAPQESSQEFLPSRLLIKKVSHYELLRRFDFFVLPVAFALLGIAYGIRISRYKQQKALFWTVALSLFLFVSFMAAKSVQTNLFFCAAVLYLPPAIVITLASIRLQKMLTGNL